MTLVVDVRDSVVGSLLYLDGEYEQNTERLLKRANLCGTVCLDIGANIGLHTISLSKCVGSEGKVFAFEPAPKNFALLQRNVKDNKCLNVSCIQAAVGNSIGSCHLALNPSNFGDHRVTQRGDQQLSVKVPLTTIDDVLKGVPDRSVGLIKMDVQGFEVHVLQGMVETLRRNPDVILLAEVFPEGLGQAGHSAEEMVQYLQSVGFMGWEIHNHRFIPMLEPSAYNLIGGGKYVDLLLAKSAERLDRVLADGLAGYHRPTSRSFVT